MKLKFDIQFFGSGGSTQQVRKRDPEPTELTDLRNELYNKILPGLQSFNANSWSQAQNTANNALQQQNQLLGQLPNSLSQGNNILNNMMNVVKTGNIPTGITDKLNSGVNKELQSSMGNMLNGLSNRGVLNSSITSQGISRLGQQAADAYNKNYLSAFNSVINGYGQGLQGALGNTNSLLSGLQAVGNIPSNAYEGAYAGLMPAFNFWKAWQNSYDGREDYDTIVQQGSSCITGDTLITLSSGKEIPVSELKNSDKIKSWDFEKGCVTSAPLTAFFKHTSDNEYNVIRIKFEDNSSVGIIDEHLFFDLTIGKFVAVNSDSQEFIGHEFAKVTTDGHIIPVKVTKIFQDGKASESYAPQSEGHLNFLANGFISGNDGQLGLCNRFDFDIEKMRYNPDKKANDLENYGKLDYNYFKNIISKDFFYKNHCEEFSVAFAKGLMSRNEFKAYLEKFAHCFLKGE